MTGEMRPSLQPIALNLLSLAVFASVWQAGSMAVGSPFFPAPLEIVRAFLRLAASGDTQGTSLWTHSWASLYRVLVGFAAGVLLGVPLGLLMGLYITFALGHEHQHECQPESTRCAGGCQGNEALQ